MIMLQGEMNKVMVDIAEIIVFMDSFLGEKVVIIPLPLFWAVADVISKSQKFSTEGIGYWAGPCWGAKTADFL